MRILQEHLDYIEYEPVKKEIAGAEEAEERKVRLEEIVVVFTSVEAGDDEEISRKAIDGTKELLEKLGVNRILIYPYAHLSQDLAKPAQALAVLKEMERYAAEQGLEVHRAPFGWNKAFTIKVKGHPLAEMSRTYSNVAVEKASRWETTAKKESRESHKELLSRMKKSDYAGLPETDHRTLGERLDLFSFYEPSPSMPFWHDKGLTLKNVLIETIRRELRNRDYIEISTALLANVDLWKVSGHFEHYKDNMFMTKLKDDAEEAFGLKPMNCPSTILYYMSRRRSYRELPLRIADFDLLFRKELSGVVTGLFRVKSFTQDDAHIFCTEDQVEKELENLIDLVDYFYGIFKLKYMPKVSTMPDEHLGTEEQWSSATEILTRAVRSKGVEPLIKEKEGTFYGPKIDIDVKDSLGREWQCATIQLDFQLPQRFELTYAGKDGRDHTPVMIHRVIYGSLERFIGIIVEHYQGKFPLWLAPVQVKVLPVSDANKEYAERVMRDLRKNGLRTEIDLEGGTVNSKIRNAQLQKIPFMLVLGNREQKEGTLAVREREGQVTHGVKTQDFLAETKSAIESFS